MALAAVAVLAGAPQAWAWKPSTHVYLAEQARLDAIDDGRVTIMRVDRATGKVLGPLGTFEVDPVLRQALAARPEEFRAGVLGPDAYPDLLTGQRVIHPPVAEAIDGSVRGSDAWLQHLWRQAGDRPEERAFVTGYLTHAAGDVFAHTYVNAFTGGPFTMTPPTNAARHVVLEGYLAKRTPDSPAPLTFSSASVQDFIRRAMIVAPPGSDLDRKLLLGADSGSVPVYFSALRNSLQAKVDDYYATLERLGWFERQVYRVGNAAQVTYYEAWIVDIDQGLEAWPKVSEEVARAIVFAPNGADPKRARAVMSDYVEDHLTLMMGAPAAAVKLAYLPGHILDLILPQSVQDMLTALKRAPLEYAVKLATGLSVEDWVAYGENPQTHFDTIMGPAVENARGVTLAAFNREQLGLSDAGYQDAAQRWDPQTFAPAFNTLQMSKMALLSQAGREDLDRALRQHGQGLGDTSRNLMLGWAQSLDDGNQWAEAPPAPFAAGQPSAFRTLFMPQPGFAAFERL